AEKGTCSSSKRNTRRSSMPRTTTGRPRSRSSASPRRVDRPGQGPARRRAASDARGGRSRRSQREAHRDRLVPARELLGEMLMALKQPAAALKEFEQSQVREPNRLRGYAGAAAAAEAAGDRGRA